MTNEALLGVHRLASFLAVQVYTPPSLNIMSDRVTLSIEMLVPFGRVRVSMPSPPAGSVPHVMVTSSPTSGQNSAEGGALAILLQLSETNCISTSTVA